MSTEERPRAISPDDVVSEAQWLASVTAQSADDGRLIWEEIQAEQRRKHWGPL